MPYKSKGVTLIELLISLVVLACGLLALAKMQLLTLNYDNQSYFYSLATIRLQSLVERIYADPNNLSFELKQWNHNNAKLLPEGFGNIYGSDPFELMISWQEKTTKKQLSLKIMGLKEK